MHRIPTVALVGSALLMLLLWPHRLCRLIWKMLHPRIRYEERGPAVSVEAKKVRARKMIRELRRLGYRVELLSPPAGSPA